MEHGCPARRHHRALTDDIIAAISALAVYHIEKSMEHSHPVRCHHRSDRLGATESPMSSSYSSLLYAPDAFDVDVRALEVVLDLLLELSDVTVEHRTKVMNDVIHGL